jgi:hypothetical protein
MSVGFTVEQAHGITFVRFHKVGQFDDAIQAAAAVEGLQDNHLRLWDLSSGVDVSFADVRLIAEHAKSNLSEPSKVAIVAPRDHVYGIARMHETLREHPNVSYRVFRLEEEAVAWLLEA